MRRLFLFILFVAVTASIGHARDYGVTYLNEPYQSQAYPESALASPPRPVPLSLVTDSVANDTVGRVTTHQVGFQLPAYTFQPGGLLRGRQVVVTFPPDFETATVDSVTYRDTDDLSTDPRVVWLYIYSQSVVVRFSDAIPGPNGPYFVYLTFHSLTNATVAENHRITIKVDNIFGQTVAGPTFSESFPLVADIPQTLALLPKEDTVLAAGNGILFEPQLRDQYGNLVSGRTVDLSMDPQMDPIGQLFGYYFLSRTTGTGRVLAQFGDLMATSGRINVKAGTPAVLTLSPGPDSVRAGEGLPHDVTVMVTDQFRNRVEDYLGAIWFSSDDPLSEFVHDAQNPYRFTADDRGQRTFPGKEFIFRTAGKKSLQVTDKVLIGQRSDITVYPAGLDFCAISWPDMVRAGDSFIIAIQNAQDHFGNAYTGLLFVSGGEVAPDGTLPQTGDIFVINGVGQRTIMLPAAGNNTMTVAGDGFLREITIPVMPGELAALGIDLAPTQFIGHAFRSPASITAYDRFHNRKSDFAQSGTVMTLAADSGQIIPDTIAAGQFDLGVGDISAYQYAGPPGEVILQVTTRNQKIPITAQSVFWANGITMVIDTGRTPLPVRIPEMWTFTLIGNGINPGNLTPLSVAYRANFAEADELVPLRVRPSDCLPLPHDPVGCQFSGKPFTAGYAPGVHDFVLQADAAYASGDDTLTAMTVDTHQIEIVSFIPPEARPLVVHDTALAADYVMPFTLALTNQNDFPASVVFDVSVYIENDGGVIYLGQGISINPMESEIPIQALLQFTEDIPIGTYRYTIRYRISYSDGAFGTASYMSPFIPFDRTLAVVPRATYNADTNSVRPGRVTGGSETAFSFDLLLNGTTSVFLNAADCPLVLTDGSVSVTTGFSTPTITLVPGRNTLQLEPVLVPASWHGKVITAQLRLAGMEADVAPVDTVLMFPFPITVENFPELQMLSLTLIAPNAPFLNVGQEFSLEAIVINRSASLVSAPALRFTSDGNSLPDSGLSATAPDIQPFDTVKVVVSAQADSFANPAELFSVSIAPSGQYNVLLPIDDKAVAVIEAPATVTLAPGSVSIPSIVPYLDFGELFQVVVRFDDFDPKRISGGSLILDYSGPGSFGVSFPVEKALDSLVIWDLQAPQLELAGVFTVAWKTTPIDRNTSRPIADPGQTLSLPFAIRASITKLVIEADSFTTQPLQRGQTSSLFRLGVQNVTNDSRNKVRLNSVAMAVIDRDGKQIDAGGVIADSGTAFYINESPISQLSFTGGRAVFQFADLVIMPGQKITMTLRLTPSREANLDYFNLRLDGDAFAAEIADGPRIGQPVQVTGLLDRPFGVSLPQAIIAENLGESFKNYPNPFNPVLGNTEIRYFLPSESDVDIMIFTATGEKVREFHFTAGSEGGQGGANDGIWWDGRNGEGDVVLNGVYIAIVKVAAGDLTAKLKIAVIK